MKTIRRLTQGVSLIAIYAACGPAGDSPSALDDERQRAAFMVRAQTEAAEFGHIHNEVQRDIFAALVQDREQHGRVRKETLDSVQVRLAGAHSRA